MKDNVKAGATKGNAAPRRARAGKSSQQRARSPRGAAASKKSRNDSAKDKERRPGGARLPDFVPPSLATLRATAPSGTGWAHEIKFDGYRIQARLDRARASIGAKNFRTSPPPLPSCLRTPRSSTARS